MAQADAAGQAGPTRNLNLLRAVADRTLRFRFGTWYWGDAIAIDGLLAAHAS